MQVLHHMEPGGVGFQIIVIRSKVATVSSMQHLLQNVPLTLSQVSKVNQRGIQNFIKNDSFECRVKCRYAKTLAYLSLMHMKIL